MNGPLASNADALCPGCFEEPRTSFSCRRCGFDCETRRPNVFLPVHTYLDEQYVVGRPLGNPGGFGITYLAWHPLLRSRVAIKEFLPRQLAVRSANGYNVVPHSDAEASAFAFGLEAFCREAQTLEQLEHRNIVRVRGLFTANGTAYMVMRYYDGETLDELLDRSGGHISENQALRLMAPILDALHQEVHRRSYLHRDISPQNIYLATNQDGDLQPLLLDFGAARMALGDRTQSLSVILKPGYAPYEQYGQDAAPQGPWTDVYACAATLYKAVTGSVPMPSINRWNADPLKPPHQLVPSLSRSFSDAVMQGLCVRETDRPPSIAAFRSLLYDAPPPLPVIPQIVPSNDRRPLPILRVLQGEAAGQDVPLDPDDPVILGRDPRLCHLVLQRRDLSRQHCAVTFRSADQAFELEDLATANGTFLTRPDGTAERLDPGNKTPLEPGQSFFLVDRQSLFQLVLETRTTQPERPLPNPIDRGGNYPRTYGRPGGCLMFLVLGLPLAGSWIAWHTAETWREWTLWILASIF